jgi:X-Pro dipeptidyl-peptidase
MTSTPWVAALAGAVMWGAAWTTAAAAQSSAPALPVFRDGQAQPVPAFSDPSRWVRHDLWVETELDTDGDGALDRVHVGITRPAQTDTEGLRVPVIYESSPYFAGVGSAAPRFFWDVRHGLGETPPPRTPMPPIPPRALRPVISASLVRDWVPRGFAVVHSESPGTGLSQGCPTIGGRNETLAPKAVIDWLNGRARGFTEPEGGDPVHAPWSTGKVAMTGTSFDGTLALAAATTGVDGLEAIVPIAPNTSYYHYYRSHGLVRSPGGYLGEDVDVLFDFVNSGDPDRRGYCMRAVRDGELADGQDRITGDYSDFWAGRDYVSQAGGIRAATLLAHGLGDWNVMAEHSLRVYRALRARGVPVQAYLHQGGHGGGPPFELVNRWLTRHLYGVENGVEEGPRVWIVREGDSPERPTPYADYPHPDARDVVLGLTAGGRATGGLGVDAPAGQGREAVLDDVAFAGAELARAAGLPHRLLYVTPELRAPIHVSGTPRVTVRLSSSRPAANLSVWLVALPWVDRPDQAASLITRGWADPQNHASLSRSEALVPGRFYDVTFELQPDDQVIEAGRRIGLMIFSSDREFTLWPPAGTELTVDLDATRLFLPVVGGEGAWREASGGAGR